MKIYYLWFDNGTGWYEGPYEQKAENERIAVTKQDLTYFQLQGQLFYSFNKEDNPNVSFENFEIVMP